MLIIRIPMHIRSPQSCRWSCRRTRSPGSKVVVRWWSWLCGAFRVGGDGCLMGAGLMEQGRGLVDGSTFRVREDRGFAWFT